MHLNVFRLRSNIEEQRCLQLLCRFEILEVQKVTRFDKSVPDLAVNILGMEFRRLDRKGRKGGGCILYYADHLQAFLCKDLLTKSIEAAWLLVNFPSASILFSVMYRCESIFRPYWLPIGESLVENIKYSFIRRF